MAAAEIRLDGLDRLKAALAGLPARVDAAARGIVTDGGHLVEAGVKAQFQGRHARGEPHQGGSAPNIVTGTARRSVSVRKVNKVPGGWQSQTGPSVVYGRRLELGFQGVDSLGRHYQQPAYPFVKPGLTSKRRQIARLARARWAAALKGV